MRRVYILFLLLSASAISRAQDSKLIEIEKTDITANKHFKSDKASFFGFKLGMGIKAAEKHWATLPQFIAKYDNLTHDGTLRYYLYDKNETGEQKNCVAYLIWNKGDTAMAQISFFPDAEPYLQGNTKKLLTFEAIDVYSDLYKHFLGKASKTAITLDVPDIHLRHKTFYFHKHGIEICEQHDEKDHRVVFAIVPVKDTP